jgi:hypothetical protein
VLYFLLLEDLSIFLIVFSGLLSAKWAVVHNTIEPALKVLCSSKLNFQFLEMNFQNERTVSEQGIEILGDSMYAPLLEKLLAAAGAQEIERMLCG